MGNNWATRWKIIPFESLMTEGGIRCEECGKELPQANAQLHALRCPGVLANGCAVYYLDRKEEPPVLRCATVIAVDRTLKPPSYTIRIGESERETERSRLFVNKPAVEEA